MKIQNRIATAYNVLRNKPAKNSMGVQEARRFMKYGSRRQAPLVEDWSQILMDDASSYTGYMYAAINNRANGVAQLAEGNLVTEAKQSLMEKASEEEQMITHPYLNVLNNSDTFSNYKFWYGTSGYLDLKGVYFLFVLRNVAGNGEKKLVGTPQEFKLLNPYHVKRVINKKTGELGGYVEERGGQYREIPKEMIIEVRKFNPFSSNDPFSTSDAAKDSQYTLKKSGDYTRHAIAKNLNSPGVIAVGDNDLMVDQNEFENFKARVLGHEKGEPIFAIGDSLKFDPMQIDLDKAALADVHEINLSGIIAVTGNSKTMFGIEQSGVTRDTAKVQKDLFIGNHVIPQLQLIIDAFNLDYKRYYPDEYKQTEYKLTIDSPLKTDRDAEMKDTEIKTANFELYQSLVSKGYDPELSAKFVEGKITLETLSAEAPEPQEQTDTGTDTDTGDDDEEDEEEQNQNAKHDHDYPHDHIAVENALEDAEDYQKSVVIQQQGVLENAVTNIQARMVAKVIERIEKKASKATNAVEDGYVWKESDLMTKTQESEFEKELEIALAAFYGVIFLLWAPNINSKRLAEYNRQAAFKMDKETKAYIKEISKKASNSHIRTVMDDILVDVRAQALKGASIQNIVDSLTKKYQGTISKTRAKAIARTETNRAFTMTQYEYDRQWLAQNSDYLAEQGLQAYKVWHTRSVAPCPFCQGMEARGPIPFNEPFANIGETLTATGTDDSGNTKVRKMVVAFDTPVAGNLHVNCACDYTLLLK